MAPAFGAAGTVLTGADAQTTANVPAPAGVAAGAIVLVQLYKENGAAVTVPTGFTEVGTAPSTTGSAQWHHVFWKRATASEPATYNFSWTGAIYRAAVAHSYTGCVTTGSPIDVTNAAARSTNGTVTPAVSVTTTGPDRLLVWLGSSFNTVGWTAPSGYTLRVPPSSLVLAAATQAQPAAGTSGSVTGTQTSGSSTQTAQLIALIPEGGTASGYPSIVQAAQMLSPARPATTCVGTITAATAGQAIVAAVAGDKNTGTVQFSDNVDTDGSDWSEVFELTSTSVSLYLAFKTAAGGETTITATHTGSAAQGDTGWIAVLDQTGTAAWGVVASASSLTTEVAVATCSTGTTGAATYNGLGFALAAIDSIVSITGTPSWTNGYVNTGTNGNTPPAAGVAGSGGGSGGLYAATKQVDAATTTTSTFATNGGTDQLTGAIAVIGRQGSGGDPVGTGTVLRNPRVGIDKIGLRLSGVTSVRVDFSLTSDMASPVSSADLTPDGQGNAHVALPALAPNTTYYFQPYSGAGYIGTQRSFKTLPGAAQTSMVIAFASCRNTDEDAVVLSALPARGAQMMLFTGDGHYRDINSTDASLYRAADDEPYTRTHLGATLTTIPNTQVWDDHDFCGDASWSGSTGRATVAQVFRERVPTPTLAGSGGIYHTFTVWGGRVRIIVLDCRYYRDQIGTNADGTMLGSAQLTWLQGLLADPDTPLTFIVSSVGWQSAGSDDDWGFYQNERTTIAGWIAAADTEVVFLCGDMHRLAIATPAQSTPGGVHVWHAAAMRQFDNGVKGGPYAATQTYYAAGSCGLVELVDDGDEITATFRGLQSGTSDWASTDTVTVSTAIGPESGRMLLLAL